MQPTRREAPVLRKKLLLIVGLIAVSTALYVIGVAVERSQEATEGAGAHQEVSGTPDDGEARESREAKESEGVHQEPGSQEDSEAGEQQSETILGINPEATWVVATVVVGWLVLAVALLLFGPRVLILIALVAATATVFDTLEVLGQLGRDNGGVAALAAVVALVHAAIALLSIFALRAHRGTYNRPTHGG